MTDTRIDTTWMDQAACTDEPIATFFGRDGERADAREIREFEAIRDFCAGCPVRAACLDYAVATDSKDGVWGGMGEAQLKGERRRRQRRKPYTRTQPSTVTVIKPDTRGGHGGYHGMGHCGHCGYSHRLTAKGRLVAHVDRQTLAGCAGGGGLPAGVAAAS